MVGNQSYLRETKTKGDHLIMAKKKKAKGKAKGKGKAKRSPSQKGLVKKGVRKVERGLKKAAKTVSRYAKASAKSAKYLEQLVSVLDSTKSELAELKKSASAKVPKEKKEKKSKKGKSKKAKKAKKVDKAEAPKKRKKAKKAKKVKKAQKEESEDGRKGSLISSDNQAHEMGEPISSFTKRKVTKSFSEKFVERVALIEQPSNINKFVQVFRGVSGKEYRVEPMQRCSDATLGDIGDIVIRHGHGWSHYYFYPANGPIKKKDKFRYFVLFDPSIRYYIVVRDKLSHIKQSHQAGEYVMLDKKTAALKNAKTSNHQCRLHRNKNGNHGGLKNRDIIFRDRKLKVKRKKRAKETGK